MPRYDNKKNYYEKRTRSSIELMKLKVTVGLYFFRKIEIEKEEREINSIMEKTLQQWSKAKGYKFSVRRVELPHYIRGHSVYLQHDTRHCKILTFSK